MLRLLSYFGPMFSSSFYKDLEYYFAEDDLERNAFYGESLPKDLVNCQLKFKDDLIIAGLPFFFQAFKFLDHSFEIPDFQDWEGRSVKKEDRLEFEFNLPFSVVLTGERIALNLLQRASSIASYTNDCVLMAQEKGVKILDTRKTTPGHRALEKYAVRIGGGFNHRMGQGDAWMIKDNHKSFFGGVKEALSFFSNLQSFYTPLILEVHNLEELNEAIELGVRHVMLDNFSSELIKEALLIKPAQMTYEVSGGVSRENLKTFLIEGIDAISMGSLTYNAPHKDISLKYQRSV